MVVDVLIPSLQCMPTECKYATWVPCSWGGSLQLFLFAGGSDFSNHYVVLRLKQALAGQTRKRHYPIVLECAPETAVLKGKAFNRSQTLDSFEK
eukprot:5810465-Amphidinium_carterae.1